MYDPWAALDEHAPHVLIVKTRLPRGDAWWVPSEAAIAVDDRLPLPAERFAVAHEFEHVDAGDVPVDLVFFSKKQEARATRRATQKCIRLSDFVDALLWCSTKEELAHQLVVPPEVLERWYDRLPQHQKDRVERLVWEAEGVLSA